MFSTERLHLRDLTLDDVDNLAGIFLDPVAMKFYPSLKDRDQTVGWIEWNRRNYERYGHGLWAAHLQETDEFVGQCGLICQEVEGEREVEIAYLLLRKYWNRGYATEAAAASRDFAFKRTEARRVVSLIDPPNVASRRVAEKVGLRQVKEIAKWDKQVLVYAQDRLGSETLNL